MRWPPIPPQLTSMVGHTTRWGQRHSRTIGGEAHPPERPHNRDRDWARPTSLPKSEERVDIGVSSGWYLQMRLQNGILSYPICRAEFKNSSDQEAEILLKPFANPEACSLGFLPWGELIFSASGDRLPGVHLKE